MPPSKHAVLSASGAHRWLHCNPSARLELEFADRETEAAAEGTAAHALAEHKLKKALKIRSRKPVSPYDCDEMDAHTDGYVEFVLEQLEEAKTLCADPLILIEQRLDFSCYVPDGFGTGDCLIVADKLLHIIDFKYGQGVLVDAEENPQMMLYALGALRQFDHLYDITQVAMSIYQPRRENVSTWTITVEQLMIHNPMTVAMGDTGEMQKAIEMLSSVKESIINAYEIKTGISRAKLSHLMDAETWMDARKAVELGFADEVMKRPAEAEDMDAPTITTLYSKASVVNSLMDKIAEKCKTNRPTTRAEPNGRCVDHLYERLNLLKF